ncbi:hypothetical protein [Streptomyces sp. NPDC001380]|uniref:hypothetical protein n=1 Tax=Streptomyces sp. NPDC001380 TaxID=3364566 RepID=UPI0036A9D3D0
MRRIDVSGYTRSDGTRVRAHTRLIKGFSDGTLLAVVGAVMAFNVSGTMSRTGPDGPGGTPREVPAVHQGVVFRPGHLPVPGPAVTVRVGPQHP